MTAPAARHWDITVARATPATLILKTITKSRFKRKLITPAINKIKRGRKVSPFARRRADPKLYIIVAVIPAK